MLEAVDVTFGFSGRRDFLKPVRLQTAGGQCWGIIGPNGAGKSTLLRLLAGLRQPTSGRVLVKGRDLRMMPGRERACTLSFLPQHLPKDLAETAWQIVLMGRFPFRDWGLFESSEDIECAHRAMRTTETGSFASRPLAGLSGGEAQRVHLAAALAQQPSVLLLDEPTAALDLYHQVAIFELLRRLAVSDGLCVIVVTHDLNLAARYCTHVLLLNDGRTVAAGPPSEVLTPAMLEPVYGVKLVELSPVGGAGRWLVPLAGSPAPSKGTP